MEWRRGSFTEGLTEKGITPEILQRIFEELGKNVMHEYLHQ